MKFHHCWHTLEKRFWSPPGTIDDCTPSGKKTLRRPWTQGLAKDTRIQKYLDTTHRKAGVRQYTHTILKMNRH